jgi:hypothetical protein
MASFYNNKISTTYVSIIKSLDNAALTSSLKELSDGSGNATGLFMNTGGDFKVTNILEWGTLKDTGENISITKFVDEADGIASNDNDTSIPTSAAVVDYVASRITLEDLDFSGTTGTGSVDLDSQVFAIVGTTNEIETTAGSQQLQIGLPDNVTIGGNLQVNGLLKGNNNLVVKDTSDRTMAAFYGGGKVELYFNDSKKLESTSDGVTITGGLTATGSSVFTSASFSGTITGDVTGDLTGDVTGDLTGNVTATSVLANGVTATTLGWLSDSNAVATTAFVQSNIDTVNTLSKILALGNTTGATKISVDNTSGGIDFIDNAKARFGTGNDLEIYHDGSNSYITDSTAELRIKSQSLRLQGSDGSDLIQADEAGGVRLYDNGSQKLEVVSSGAVVTGTVTSDGLDVGDNEKIRLGASQDLEIYHNGTHSYIDDTGTGSLRIRSSDIQLEKYTGEMMLVGNSDGAVTLYYDGSAKLATTSTGISVTGNMVASGDVYAEDNIYLTDTGTARGAISLDSSDRDNLNIKAISLGSLMRFYTQDTLALSLDDSQNASFSGAVTISGDLTVNGTTTTVNTDHFNVEDPLISMAKDNAANTVDIGFYGKYTESATVKYLGLFSDASDSNRYKLFKGLQTEPTTTVNTSGTGYEYADILLASLESRGNLTIKQQDDSGFDGGLIITRSANTQKLVIGMDGGAINFNSPDSLTYKFRANGTEKASIDGSGNATFAGSITGTSASLTTGGTVLSLDRTGGATALIELKVGGTVEGYLGATTTKSLVVFNESASEKFSISNTGSGTFAGKIGVGGTASSRGIEVSGAGALGTLSVSDGTVETVLWGDASGTNIGGVGTNNNYGFNIYQNGGAAIEIDTSKNATFAGNVTLENASSPTVRLKDTTNNCEAFLYAQNSNAHVGTQSNHSFIIDTNNTTALTLDTSQDATFAGDVTLSNASTPQLRVTDTTNSVISKIMSDNTTGFVGTHSDHNFSILRNNSVQATFTSTGLGIGTTNPLLDVQINSATDSNATLAYSENDTLKWYTRHNASDDSFQIVDVPNTTTALNIASGGNATFAGAVDINGGLTVSPNTAGKDTFTLTTNASNDGRLLIKSDTSTKVDIQANGDSYFNGGKVGIGNNSPDALLEVGSSTSTGAQYISIDGAAAQEAGIQIRSAGTIEWYIYRPPSSDDLRLYNGSDRIIFKEDGLTTIKRTGITGVTKNDITLQVGYEGNNGQNNLIGFGYNAGSAIPAYIGYTTTSGSSNTKGDLIFGTRDVVTDSDPSECMRITSSGEILKGITSAVGVGGTPADANSTEIGNGYIILARDDTATVKQISFGKNGSEVGSIETTGSATAYNTSSDYRLKENVVSMTDALDRVSQLKPSRFNFKADADKVVDGFLAHEVQDIVPEAISGEKDAMQDEEYEITPAKYKTVVHPAEDAVYETIEHPAIEEELDDEGNVIVEGQEAYTEEKLITEAKEEWSEEVLESEAVMGTRQIPDYQGIDQSKLVPLLVGAIQELEARIKELENK